MEEVRLWRVQSNGAASAKVERVEGVDTMSAEKLLEDVLTHSPDVLMEGLTIIGRQNETDGGPLDLLGVVELVVIGNGANRGQRAQKCFVEVTQQGCEGWVALLAAGITLVLVFA